MTKNPTKLKKEKSEFVKQESMKKSEANKKVVQDSPANKETIQQLDQIVEFKTDGKAQ